MVASSEEAGTAANEVFLTAWAGFGVTLLIAFSLSLKRARRRFEKLDAISAKEKGVDQ